MKFKQYLIEAKGDTAKDLMLKAQKRKDLKAATYWKNRMGKDDITKSTKSTKPAKPAKQDPKAKVQNTANTDKKYVLTNETKEFNNVTLYRIKALKDFSDVKVGDIGGYIMSEDNLSHHDDAWVSGDARVYGKAHVSGDARVYGDAWVSGNARVYDNARVYGKSHVYGKAHVYGKSRVYGDAWVYDNARVYGDAQVYGDARVRGNAIIKDEQVVITGYITDSNSAIKQQLMK
jgi:cytoskeletal protein CcmA (bactofilin family)